MLGHSLGSLFTLKLSIQARNDFRGMGLLTPYLRGKYEDMLNKYLPIAKFIDKFYPSYKLAPFPTKEKPKRHIEEMNKDPLIEYRKVAVRNVLLNREILQRFHESEVQ
jgi:uncharacterized ubiquitin-like protein YukD